MNDLSLMDVVTEHPLRTKDMRNLSDCARMAEHWIMMGEKMLRLADERGQAADHEMRVEGQAWIDEGKAVAALIEAEMQRRRDLIAAAPTFETGTRVRVAQELEDWNKAASTQPPVGIEGTVAALADSLDKHMPEGKVAVHLRLSDLGYLGCGDEEKVFYIWAWSLDEVKPEVNLDVGDATPTP